ncbi:MAG TPA: LysR family transcriptional regulator [Bryobacteraceae bacterium]|jgi:DNA-binding transcriptional LysR family regulator
MDVDLRHLHAFVAVARHGNFTRAARAVHISQPTFTVQIQQLETALGVRLVDRNTRSVQLTPIGRDLAPVLERILQDLDSALLNTQLLSRQASGFVAIAALPTLSATVLPGIISAFRRDNPGIAIHLKDAVAIRVAAMVRAGEVDFGFGSVPASEPDVTFTPLFNDHMSAIFPRESPLRQKRSISLGDLTSRPLILMGRDSSVRAVVDRAFASIGHFAPPSYEASYISTALGMVEAGLGITILPASVLRMDRGRNLVSRPIQKPRIDRDVGFIQLRGRTLSPAAATLQRAIRERCAELFGRKARSD